MSDFDERRLREECEKYGLPVGLDGLLRHIYANKDMTIENWKAVAEGRKQKLLAVEALATHFEQEGITCECGHYVGGDHNGLGCYARLSYQPLVTCPCKLTDDQDESEIVAKAIRKALGAGI